MSPHSSALLNYFRGQPSRLPPALSLGLIAPLLCMVTVFFVVPLLSLVPTSVGNPGARMEHYGRFLGTDTYQSVFVRTFRVALEVTVIALVLAYPVALFLRKQAGTRLNLLLLIILLPLWTSVVIRTYAWIVLLQRKGVINDVLTATGVLETPARLLYTEGAVIIGMVHALLPFLVLSLYNSVRAIGMGVERAAESLGASPWQVFWRVTVPLSLPGAVAGSILVFVLALGFYITPALLGGPSDMFVATLVAQQIGLVLNLPFAAAISLVLLVSTGALLVALELLVKPWLKSFSGSQ